MEAYYLIGRNYDDSNLPRIQEYLESGGDPNLQLYGGVTVFIEAVVFFTDNINVICELLNSGADVNLSTHLGVTPLQLAATIRKRRVVQALIQAGASLNAKNYLGLTVLHHSVHKWILNLLGTPIRYEPDMWIINYLLKQEDIDCNQVDFYGQTPLLMAIMDQQRDIASLLLSYNANPNIGNKLSVTPLHVAFSQTGHFVELELLRCGASIYSVDKNGRTPLDVLLEIGWDIRTNRMVITILKTIAFVFFITRNLKQKFEPFPQLSQDFNQFCKEADHMRGDYIYGNITMHDFIWDCFPESDSDIHILQIHKAVVDKLVKNVYPEYLHDIINKIPTSSLRQILKMSAKKRRQVNDLGLLLSNSDINDSICMHLNRNEVFVLIQVLSGVTISE